MLFNTIQYGVFFVVIFALHWILPQSWRRPFLLLASYYFYASAIPQYLLLILGMTIFNYALGLNIPRLSGRARLALLWVGLVGNLGCLAYFKYTGFFLQTLQPLLSKLPLLSPITQDGLALNILLPLGISFFAFEFIHYLVEVWRGKPIIRNPVDFALFAAFFPTQIAGPIKRFPDFVKQLQKPLALREVNVDAGIGLILRGLVKKIIFADVLATFVAQAFATPDTLGAGSAWIAVCAFAVQIYGDFSGYTDIGRGCATLLGYYVPENFNRPYQAANPAEFWHRWHMSLSTWLRDYLFIPLGGSRVAAPLIYLNLMITMTLGGLWHGASAHFIVWGVYQGALLCGHRLWSSTVGALRGYQALVRFPPIAFLTRPITFAFVCGGWVFFRADSVASSFKMLASMLDLSRPLLAGNTLTPFAFPSLVLMAAAVVLLSGWLWAVLRPPFVRLGTLLARYIDHLWIERAQTFIFRPALYSAAIALLILWPPQGLHRFIYFQF